MPRRKKTEIAVVPAEGRDARGRFTDRNGGGPGRPVGRRSALNMLLDDKRDAAMPGLVDKAIEKGLAGEWGPLHFLLCHGYRPESERPFPHAQTEFTKPAHAVQAGETILRAAADGEITAQQAADELANIRVQRDSIVANIHEDQIREIKELLAKALKQDKPQ